MAKDTSQKLKMTRILDMLRMDSSKEEPLTTDILCSRLMNEFQIVCDRRPFQQTYSICASMDLI